MIVTVTANPALDVTYEVDELVPGRTHRVTAVHERAGGKGINVSRVLHERGVPTLAIAPVGGARGDLLRADLTASGVPHRLLDVSAPTRTTVSVNGGGTTMLNEPGSPLTPTELRTLTDLVHAQPRRVLVCSGSLPQGTPADYYADLVSGLSIVDTSGPGILAAARAGAVLKPNVDELREIATTPQDLIALGAKAVIVSDGPAGMTALTRDGQWQATPPYTVQGNPTGAGDAAVAALAHGLADDRPWPELLRMAVAWSAAAVAAPTAGSVDPALADELMAGVTVRRLPAT